MSIETESPAQNTDRELYREPDAGNGSFYSDSVFVTEGGAIGMNVGGSVIVKSIRAWHELATNPRFVYDTEKRTLVPVSPSSPLPWDSRANRHYEPVERRAEQIYAGLAYDGPGEKPAWVPHGNSTKQDEARQAARSELQKARR
jgi:hypothetical protein